MVVFNWLLIVLVGALMVVDVGLRLQLRREHARYQKAHELMRRSLEKAVKDSDGLVEVCQQMIRLGKRSDSFSGTVPTRGMEVTHNLLLDDMLAAIDAARPCCSLDSRFAAEDEFHEHVVDIEQIRKWS